MKAQRSYYKDFRLEPKNLKSKAARVEHGIFTGKRSLSRKGKSLARMFSTLETLECIQLNLFDECY